MSYLTPPLYDKDESHNSRRNYVELRVIGQVPAPFQTPFAVIRIEIVEIEHYAPPIVTTLVRVLLRLCHLQT